MLLPPANVVCESYVFTGVCLSVHVGGCLVLGAAWSGRGGAWSTGCLLRGGVCSPGGTWWRPPRTVTAAGGTHPTGMHSCLRYKKNLFGF